jgi:hypothetical protein
MAYSYADYMVQVTLRKTGIYFVSLYVLFCMID